MKGNRKVGTMEGQKALSASPVEGSRACGMSCSPGFIPPPDLQDRSLQEVSPATARLGLVLGKGFFLSTSFSRRLLYFSHIHFLPAHTNLWSSTSTKYSLTIFLFALSSSAQKFLALTTSIKFMTPTPSALELPILSGSTLTP